MFCNFCNRRRDEAAELFGGSGVYICDSCVGFYARELEDDDALASSVRRLVRNIERGKVTERREVTACLEACMRLAIGNVDLLLELAADSVSFGRYDTALEILGAIESTDRNDDWYWLKAVSEASNGNLARAVEVLDDALDFADLPARRRIYYRLNQLMFRADIEADESVIPAMMNDLEVLEIEVRTLDKPGGLLEAIDIARAHSHHALGELQRAERLLRDVARRASLGSSSLLLFGDCLHALGRVAEAHEQWRAVTEMEDDDNHWHREASERLTAKKTPYR